MLQLINEARAEAGVPPVTLGDNIAAQLHAQSPIKDCSCSHWGLDGLKPYMRYSLAGGYQSNAENGIGPGCYCLTDDDGYARISVMEEIESAMHGLMESPGHRDNILNKHHKKVNLGLAWDKYRFQAVQHFEGDYVEFDQLPSIGGDILSFSGRVKNGARISEWGDLRAHIDYDQPTHPLTRSQQTRTDAYCPGMRAAGLVWSWMVGFWHGGDEEYETTYTLLCIDPYDVDPDAPLYPSDEEREANKKGKQITTTELWITADEWSVNGDEFSVSANIGRMLDIWGDGVYTIVLRATIDGEAGVLSQYSIFHGVTPPDTYYPGRVRPEPTATPTPTLTPTPTPTRIPGRSELYAAFDTPANLVDAQWDWHNKPDGGFQSVDFDFTIHNDVDPKDVTENHGLHLKLAQGAISGTGYGFELQVARGEGGYYGSYPSKQVIFWVSDPFDSAGARAAPDGDADDSKLSVWIAYDWGAGDYRARIAPDGEDDKGKWFGLWITDKATGETTYCGSLRFPRGADGHAAIDPWAFTTVEVYGGAPIMPIDIPEWHVSVKRPIADGGDKADAAHIGFTNWDGASPSVPNTNAAPDLAKGEIHFYVGGATERTYSEGWLDF